MKCKHCKRELPDNSVFCCWCGERQIKERKKKNAISVPQPVKRGNRWTLQLRAEGISITEDTAEACIIKAKAIRAGYLEVKKHPELITLGAAIDRDIELRSATLSPSTITGYKLIRSKRFPDLMDKPIANITRQMAQKAVNEANKQLSSKTVHNAWMYVNKVIADVTGNRLNVTTAAVVSEERAWLEPPEILKFCAAIRDEPFELGALLALSSLRKSEILALTWDNVDLKHRKIYVRGSALVLSGGIVERPQNKTKGSRRDVPIMIDRLYELLNKNKKSASFESAYVYRDNGSSLQKQIKKICLQNGLPPCGIHSLRHSFASLAASLGVPFTAVKAIGGWDNAQTVLNIYTHVANSDITTATATLQNYYKLTTSD